MRRGLPVEEVMRLLRKNRAQVYLAKHRIAKLLKAEVARLRKVAEAK